MSFAPILGGDTLDKLDVYIAHCDGVVHLAGDMTGSDPGEHALGAAKYPDLADKLPRRGAEKWFRRLLHAVGGLARTLPRQTAVHRGSGRQRRTRPEIHADGRLTRRAGRASGASQSDGPLSRLHL